MANLEFTATPNPWYTDEIITFTPSNDETAIGWQWDFESDGVVDSTTRIGSHAYSFNSVFDQFYIASLTTLGPSPETATGIIGVRNRLDFGIDVNPEYAIGFPAAETIDIGVTGATRPLDPTSFEWTIERNLASYTAISGVTGISLAFTDGGSYSVQLRADDFGVTGMAGNVQQKISDTTFEVLIIALSVTPNKVNVGDSVTYQITGDDVSDHSFRWRFGDGSYADGSLVTYQYSAGGVYNIELIVDRGTPDEKILSYDPQHANYSKLQVKVSDLSAAFTVEGQEGYSPLTAAFSDASQSSLGLTGWEWFFTGSPGVPESINETGPIFVYDTEGVYFPYLRVTDSAGFQSTATGMIEVFSSPLQIKVYKDSVLLPDPVSEDLPVTFNFEAIVENESSITSWKWELIYEDIIHGEMIISDQQSDNKIDFVHTFNTPASYKIRLTVTDTSSNTFVATETIFITENISILADPSNGSYPLNVFFSILGTASVDPALVYSGWDFTDDGIYDANGSTASYTYLSSNMYTCRLRLIWELIDKYDSYKTAGIVLEKTSVITVTYPIFSLSLEVDPKKGRKPLSVIMRGSSNTPVSTWNWSINGTSLAHTGSKLNYTFNTEGIYIVRLTASDTFGQGPLVVEQIVQVSSVLSTVDEAVDPTDFTSVLEVEGSANVLSLPLGFSFSVPLSVTGIQPSGFKSDKAVTIIFD